VQQRQLIERPLVRNWERASLGVLPPRTVSRYDHALRMVTERRGLALLEAQRGERARIDPGARVILYAQEARTAAHTERQRQRIAILTRALDAHHCLTHAPEEAHARVVRQYLAGR